MKRVFLIRHAKSSWSDPGLTDFDRPLNNRGYSDGPLMARKLAEKVGGVDCIYSSTAKRAIETTNFFVEEQQFNFSELIMEDQLYHASAKKILEIISTADNSHSSLAIVGHNPGLTQLANDFSNVTIDNVPTTGIFAVEFEIENWENILTKNGSLLFFDYPKRYKTAKNS